MQQDPLVQILFVLFLFSSITCKVKQSCKCMWSRPPGPLGKVCNRIFCCLTKATPTQEPVGLLSWTLESEGGVEMSIFSEIPKS